MEFVVFVVEPDEEVDDDDAEDPSLSALRCFEGGGCRILKSGA